jgi:fructuronate reductase
MASDPVQRLSAAVMDGLPGHVDRPGYDRRAVRTGVVHLGIGAFHRAHQAAVFDRILHEDPRWGVLGASLRSPSVRDQLEPQDGLYSLTEREGETERVRIVGAVQGVRVGPEDPRALVEAMAGPEVHLVTLTVTEKGYKLDPSSGLLLETDPDVVADLADLSQPRTAPGFLTSALQLRRERGLPPFTVLSCDNLPHNGARVRSAVLAMAERHELRLRDWVGEHGAFPASMVDRIVPATTPEDIRRVATRLGVIDEGAVKTEPFTQWVVEDAFAGERPPLEEAGVQITADVRPWEEAKLRLLNGAHSSLAYLGALAGCEFMHDAVARPTFGRFLEALWDEAATTLHPPPGLDVPSYRQALKSRFANAALQHRTRQIALDGSQKLPQRLLAPIADRLAQGRSVDALSLGVAAWMRWQVGRDDAGIAYTVDDPLAPRTQALAQAAAGAGGRALALALLGVEQVFSPDLANSRPFQEALALHLDRLLNSGAEAAAALFQVSRQPE